MLISDVAQKYNLKALLLFGSMAKKQALHPESDFDVAYIASSRLDFLAEARLATDLMAILKSSKVDVVDFKRASPFLKRNIVEQYEPFFVAEDYSLTPLEVYARRQFVDLAPLYEVLNHYVNHKLFAHDPA